MATWNDSWELQSPLKVDTRKCRKRTNLITCEDSPVLDAIFGLHPLKLFANAGALSGGFEAVHFTGVGYCTSRKCDLSLAVNMPQKFRFGKQNVPSCTMPLRFCLSRILIVTRVGQTRSIASSTRLFKVASTTAVDSAGESFTKYPCRIQNPLNSFPTETYSTTTFIDRNSRFPESTLTSSAREAKGPVSSALKGQPLRGIIYHKDIPDPIALADEDYPDWLWDLLDENKERVKAENPENRQYHRKANREAIRASNFMKNRKT